MNAVRRYLHQLNKVKSCHRNPIDSHMPHHAKCFVESSDSNLVRIWQLHRGFKSSSCLLMLRIHPFRHIIRIRIRIRICIVGSLIYGNSGPMKTKTVQ